MNIMTTIAMASEPQEALNTNGIEVARDLSNLPPIGSAEAEFQNDFIPVFPMHQLKPCPEKNTTALNMQLLNLRNT
ncbi:hypothetical protein B4U80_02976 [Leptotrombidium deliense]|uniref:Uncharacterized protein n=1 Tax=Leptotrombidium deliense TaxID=299467 RepID=A0A443SLP2_9ACAR|nr:hypothetical protein B4U80_02976 [Leptotrombidium deliense]